MRTRKEPIEGGILVVDASLPMDDEGHIQWRERTVRERRQTEKDHKEYTKTLNERVLKEFRDERDRRLMVSDWVELPSAQERLTKPQLTAWTKYRQQLRDLPAHTKNPENPKWPEAPK